MKLHTDWRKINPRVGPAHYERRPAYGLHLSVNMRRVHPYGWDAHVFGKKLMPVYAHAEDAMADADKVAQAIMKKGLETYREEGRAKKAERNRARLADAEVSPASSEG